jgi:hypothetical protein
MCFIDHSVLPYYAVARVLRGDTSLSLVELRLSLLNGLELLWKHWRYSLSNLIGVSMASLESHEKLPCR